jgi:holo-[acyl-carrier protein] synthase
MLVGVGVDLMDVGRMEAEYRGGDAELLTSLFTPTEIAYCTGKHRPAQHFAARFAAKEAFLKAFGLARGEGIPWREIEIINDDSGRPEVVLHGALRQEAERRRVRAVHVSLSHAGEMAMAEVILES